MDRRPAAGAGLGCGAVVTAAWLGYGLLGGVLPVSTDAGFLLGSLLLYAAMGSVTFAAAAGAAYLALRHRVLLPAVAIVGYAVVPVVISRDTGVLWISPLVVAPLVVPVALSETLVRARLGSLVHPPSLEGWRAVSVGVMAAVVYAGVVVLRAVLPLWRIDTGVPPQLSPTTQLAVTAWYVLGGSLVLVGLPVALNRRFGLLSPVVGLLAYLLVDLAYVQPAVADGRELAVGLLLQAWPALAVGLAAAGAAEWWFRARRGEYDADGGGGNGDGPVERTDDRGLSVEGGPFGDRV